MTEQPHSVLILALLVCVAGVGCRTTTSSHYQPQDPPTYARVWDQAIYLRRVADLRTNAEPNVFYRHYQDEARYDRSIRFIVHEAVLQELIRAGLRSARMAPEAYLECDVLEFKADVTEHETGSPDLELALVIRFRWLVPESDQVLAENIRRLERRRVLGSADVVALPFDVEQVQGFGHELLNDMLPRLIERELTLNSWLAERSQARTVLEQATE